ncbi:zinc finger CCCH domain-containing protein 39 [Phtheirospermum japonicum]|uniref:Zinc finger CCCH domain-containing protein 39 n=1 Tax=Phtheirospermum japonicum TaxID=374723 RepID=A0A830C7A8_9LAMI|nr:zinc finger CCCH domain-containing protein 39 [Phtheirospermum japonicum]
MSFPDLTQPPHPLISSPFSGETAAPFWPANDHHHHQPDLMPQFDHRPHFKKPRPSEKPPNFPPYPPMNNNPRINPPHAPNPNNTNKGTSHIFYKTRMCAKFVEGTCRNGEHCTFAHGPDDLREPPPNWQEIIREKDRGGGSGGSNNNWSGGSGNGGDDQRMIHRMKICKKYYNGEECPYGDKCNFLHERPSPKRFKVDVNNNNNNGNNIVEQRESSAISIGVTGDVRGSGGSDFDQKVFWKTKMCSKWEMGHCPFGERCHYAHGLSEQMVMNAISIPRNPSSVSTFSTPPANLGVAAPINGDEESKKASKWKVTKKINRIYADWLDDYCSPNEEKM